jgi:hypothetical protein
MSLSARALANGTRSNIGCFVISLAIGEVYHWKAIKLLSVSSTRTNEGLEVDCRLDSNAYRKGLKISDAKMSEVNIKRHAFHGDWNYEIRPRQLG